MKKGKELRKISALISLLFYSVVMVTLWGLHYFDPWDGSYQYSIDKTYGYTSSMVVIIGVCWIASLFITDSPPPTAWWDDVHVMD